MRVLPLACPLDSIHRFAYPFNVSALVTVVGHLSAIRTHTRTLVVDGGEWRHYTRSMAQVMEGGTAKLPADA